MAPDQPETLSLYQQPDQESLSLDSRFTFRCQADLPCFNQCCQTPTVILSPYDLLRLKQGLGITSTALLERYTRQEIEPNSLLPVVFIDAYRSPEGGCPFLGESGCTVYPHRPAACRLFPLTMGSRLTPDGVEDHYFCRRLDYCRGFDAEPEWTVASWMADQGFVEYDQGRREWLEILLKAVLTEELVVDALVQDLFAILAYDLDRFRRLVFDPEFLEAYDIKAEAIEDLRADDLALLKFSYRLLPTVLSPAGAQKLAGVIRRSTKFFEVD
ncbi:MAG TPA: YkgJ family cysteine cluster protein [Desulfobaccales bacterium]|nr:YkgJ family cysteine cluster protein [Desulfobaccales bacterium]